MKKKISRKREVDKTGLNMNGYEVDMLIGSDIWWKLGFDEIFWWNVL